MLGQLIRLYPLKKKMIQTMTGIYVIRMFAAHKKCQWDGKANTMFNVKLTSEKYSM